MPGRQQLNRGIQWAFVEQCHGDLIDRATSPTAAWTLWAGRPRPSFPHGEAVAGTEDPLSITRHAAAVCWALDEVARGTSSFLRTLWPVILTALLASLVHG